MMYPTFAVSALILSMLIGAEAGAATVPERFLGRWATSAASCDSDADDLAIRIDAESIQFWESDGPVRAVVERGENELALIAELSGEGETWLAAMRFELSTEGDRLTGTTAGSGQGIVRFRCLDVMHSADSILP